MRLIFTRQFGTAFIVMMAVGAVLFSTTQILPQLQQATFNYTATLSGLSMMPGGIAMLMLMPISGFASGMVQPKYLIMIGMSAVAVGLWHLTTLSGDAGFSYFVYARIFITVGLPFLFIPISTAAYVGLPPRMTNQASALINVARNIGGSIGVSLSNTVIAQNAQIHQSHLVAHTAQSSPAYQHALQQATQHFTAQGAPMIEAKQQAIGWLAQMIDRQASLLAYIDVFRYSAIITALLVPIALLLRSPKSEKN
jgi:DHA2 family multidrug resistance protein